MGTVRSLRRLWRHRLLVGLGLLPAALAALSVSWHVGLGLPPTIRSRQHRTGWAASQMLVDSVSSQIVDGGGGPVPADLVTLTARARLLANIMATSPLRDEIARRAGIDPRSLSARSPSLGEDTPRPATGPDTPSPTVMTVSFDEALPIITATVRATDQAVAARIAAAAPEVLTQYVQRVAVLDHVPVGQRLVVGPLGRPHAGTERTGPRRLLTGVAFLVVFGGWCVAIARLRRGGWTPVSA